MTENFTVKDSGSRTEFETGAKRDIQVDKPRFEFMSPFALTRIANHLRLGAVKYGEFNYAKGINNSAYVASMFRHMIQFLIGDKTEDHLSAICFNAMGIMHNQEAIKLGILPESLNDNYYYNTITK